MNQQQFDLDRKKTIAVKSRIQKFVTMSSDTRTSHQDFR